MKESEKESVEKRGVGFEERRQFDRKKLIVDVHFQGGDATGIANTSDISIGGLFLKTNTVFEIGEQLLMRITFGGEEAIFQGVIAYVEPGRGFGISFQNLSAESEAVLRKELDLI